MSRRAWTLLAVLVVLGVAIGGYFWLSRPKPAAASPAENLALATGDKEKLVTVVLSERPEGTTTLVKKGTGWTLEPPAPEGVTLDPDAVDSLAGMFASLTAESLVDEKPTDLGQFGLQPPRAEGTGTFSDGSTHTLLLGDKTPGGGSYYMQVKGNPGVYTVFTANGERLHWTTNDLRSKAVTPALNYDEITYLKLVGHDGKVIEARDKTPAESKSFQLGMGRYVLTRPYPYLHGVDPQKQDQLVKAAQAITISSFVDDHPADLSKYGLAQPRAELILKDKTAMVDFLFGAAKDSSQTYFMIRGRPNVYSTDTSSLGFLDTKAMDVADRFAFIPNIEDVDSIAITAAGHTHVLSIARSTKKAEKAGDPDVPVSAYAVDGKSLPEGTFRDFYQAVIGLLIEGEVTHAVPDRPEVTVLYTLNRGLAKTVTVGFAPYNQDFYAIFVNGACAFALTHDQVNRMLAKLDVLLK
ncbi:MAG: DUF4340 domain-containing protein [Spirochaetia bacterium]